MKLKQALSGLAEEKAEIALEAGRHAIEIVSRSRLSGASGITEEQEEVRQ